MVGIGEILWDILPDGKRLGGAPTNFVYHAQTLGGNSIPVTAVGDDDLGREIQSHLHTLGIDPSYVFVDKEHPTGTVTVKLDSKGQADFTIHKNVAWDFIPFTSELEILAEKTDLVCFGSLAQRSKASRNTIFSFLNSLPEHCIKIFDVNLRQDFYNKDILRNSMDHAHILKLNEDELPIVVGMFTSTGTEIEMLTTLMKHFQLKLLVLTKGSQGSILMQSEGQYSFLKAPHVHVKDTVGAGDAFTAVTALGYLKKKPLKKIHNEANLLAAYVCRQSGATPKIPKKIRQKLSI